MIIYFIFYFIIYNFFIFIINFMIIFITYHAVNWIQILMLEGSFSGAVRPWANMGRLRACGWANEPSTRSITGQQHEGRPGWAVQLLGLKAAELAGWCSSLLFFSFFQFLVSNFNTFSNSKCK